MVHLSNTKTEVPSILLAISNSRTYQAGACFLFTDQDQLKGEYYFSTRFPSPQANVLSSLRFWQDLLASLQGPVLLVTDLEEYAQSIRVLLHEINLKRRDRKLTPLKEMVIPKTFHDEGESVEDSMLYRFFFGVKLLLRERRNVELFKKTVQSAVVPRIKFIRVT